MTEMQPVTCPECGEETSKWKGECVNCGFDRWEETNDNGEYVFPDPNELFPQFYSLLPDEDEDLNEIHYAVYGRNGPVYALVGGPDEYYKQRTTVYDMWMEDRGVGLEAVPFEESEWSSNYYKD